MGESGARTIGIGSHQGVFKAGAKGSGTTLLGDTVLKVEKEAMEE